MLQRSLYSVLGLLALLMFTAAYSDMPLSINASLDTFSYDLEGANLRLEKLDSRWQFSPIGHQQLVVEQLKAQRLTITLKPNTKQSNGLPKDIQLPFPIRILQSEIKEVMVINGDTQQTFRNVQLQFESDQKSLSLKLIHASTPWGEAMGNMHVGNSQPFPLTGTISLKQTDAKHSYDLTTQWHGNLNTIHVDADVWVQRQQQDSWLFSSQQPLQALAKMQVQAQLSLVNNQAFSANALISDIHPEKFGLAPTAQLNLSLDVQGQMLPHLNATLHANTVNSIWNQQPIMLTAKANLLASAVSALDITLRVGKNQLVGAGQLDAQQLDVTWNADLTNLNELDKTYAGQIQASGSIKGPLHEPTLRLNVSGHALQMAHQTLIQQLDGNAAISLAKQGQIEGKFTANKLRYGKETPVDVQLTLQGLKESHQLTLNAQGPSLTLSSQLQGGMTQPTPDATLNWHGTIQQFDFSGLTSVKLTAPAPLQINTTGIQLGKTALNLTQGNVLVDYLQLSDNAVKSKGTISQIGIKSLPANRVQWPETLSGNPLFSGQWDIHANETLNATLSIKHASGDLSYRAFNGTESPFGIQRADLALTIVNNQVQLGVHMAGNHIGHLDLDLGTAVRKVENHFSVLPTAPLRLQANGALSSLAWLPMPVAMMDSEIDGQLKFSAQADGTLQTPNLSGQLTGENIVFQLASEGVALTQGKLLASFEGNRLNIQQARWVGDQGYLTSSGWLTLVNGIPNLTLDWKAEKFTALSRADRLLILSGQGNTTLNDRLLSISGNVLVDEGLIELSSEDTPSLGNDVVILGQEVEDATASTEVLLNNLRIQLGEQFSLRGRGLDAMLTGGITLNGLTNYNPHAQGSIQVSKGTFMAYGQVLSIERGILNFSGVMDNPGLDIRAMRNSKPINAGVEITGNAYQPATKLVSDPAVSESEKLAWLVLGHGLDTAGKNDYGMLSLAAGVLLSQGQSVPLQTQLARAAGLDEFSFTGGDVEGASLTLGKRLTSQIYLSYAKSITGLLDVARLTYNITPRWLLRAEAGTESAVDVLYTFSFK